MRLQDKMREQREINDSLIQHATASAERGLYAAELILQSAGTMRYRAEETIKELELVLKNLELAGDLEAENNLMGYMLATSTDVEEA